MSAMTGCDRSMLTFGQWPVRAVLDDGRGRYLANAAPHPMAAKSPNYTILHDVRMSAFLKWSTFMDSRVSQFW